VHALAALVSRAGLDHLRCELGYPGHLWPVKRPSALFIFFSILIFVSKFLKIIQTSKIHSNSHQIHKNTK
jgi:hypothetical protein